MAAVERWQIMKNDGGKTIVIGLSGRVGGQSLQLRRAQTEHRRHAERARQGDHGHRSHCGACISTLARRVETRDETYATMEAVDTRYVKFGPDIGQLQKGGVDPVEVVSTSCRSFSTCTSRIGTAVVGGAGLLPAGSGKGRPGPAFSTSWKGRKLEGMIMVELDRGASRPSDAACHRTDCARLSRQARRYDESLQGVIR